MRQLGFGEEVSGILLVTCIGIQCGSTFARVHFSDVCSCERYIAMCAYKQCIFCCCLSMKYDEVIFLLKAAV